MAGPDQHGRSLAGFLRRRVDRHNRPEMQRLIEQPADDGDIFEGLMHIGRVHYHLAVYQHFSEAEEETVPPNLEVEGRVMAVDDLDVMDLHRRGTELTLRLADGRLLDFLVANEEGTIRSTGRGLYKA
jgi:hypothetical protein